MDLLKVLASVLAAVIGIFWIVLPFLLLSALEKIRVELRETNYHLHAQRALLEQQCHALNAMRPSDALPPPPPSSRAG